jgi:hypothetical protein
VEDTYYSFYFIIEGDDNMRTDILECKEQILLWISEGRSKAFIAKELHCKQETLNRYLAIMEIKYDGN